MEQFFNIIYDEIRVRDDIPEIEAKLLIDIVTGIEDELQKENQANPHVIRHLLEYLSSLAPDILDLLVVFLIEFQGYIPKNIFTVVEEIEIERGKDFAGSDQRNINMGDGDYFEGDKNITAGNKGVAIGGNVHEIFFVPGNHDVIRKPGQDYIENQTSYFGTENEDSIRFSAYYPKEIKPNNWYSLHVYTYLQSMFDKVQKDILKLYQSNQIRASQSVYSYSVEKDKKIAIVPEIDGFEFNPPETTFTFKEDWHRTDFRMKAVNYEVGIPSIGKVSFYVGALIISEINIWLLVSDSAPYEERIKLDKPDTASIYPAIFVSYSRDDTMIVEQLGAAYKALGMKFLRDVESIRSGEEWHPTLLKMIEEADIFQLFWSNNSSKSKIVKQEWQHALSLDKKNFIRPVYWEKPMPKPPEELSHIHFAILGKSIHFEEE